MRYAISNGKILDICANEDVYARGEAYYREGKLVSFQARRQQDATIIKAAVKGNYRNYEVSLHFDAAGEITRYSCSCASQSIWHGGCKHVVAVLFALSDGRAPSSIGGAKKEKYDQDSLTDTLEKLILQEIDENFDIPAKPENSRLAKLTPRFHYRGEGEAYLTFYVGYSRLYTIKSLAKFLQAVKEGSTVRYGNGLEFNHSEGSFTIAGRRWLSFLKQEEEIYNEMLKRVTRSHTYTVKEDNRELPLSRRNIDDFFEICENSALEWDVDFIQKQEEPSLLRLSSEMPQIRFGIDRGKEELTLLAPSGLADLRYHLIKGQRYYYFLANHTLHRMAKAEAKLLAHILDVLREQKDSGKIVLTGYSHRRFISAVLPKLMGMGLIDDFDKGDSGDDLCPKFCAKLYFDTEGSDVVSRVVFSYGEDEEDYDAFDPRENDGPRDIAGEYMVKRLLEGLGFSAEAENRVFRLTGSDQIFAFMGDSPAGIEQLQDYEKAEVYITDNLRRKTVRADGGSLGVRLKGRLLDVFVQDAEFTLEELADALESYHAKKKYHRLKDGRLLSLTDEATRNMAESLTAMDVEPKDIQKGNLTLPAYRAPYIEGVVDSHNLAFKNLMKQFRSQEGAKVPASLEGIMRPYQKTGYRWLKTLIGCGFGGILADDMGLGKTLQVLAVLLESDLSELPALVVAPTSLIYNWSAEIKKFAPSLNHAVVAGTPEKRLDILMTRDVNVFITTYDAMKRDVEIYQQIHYKFVIADEAQNIKNPATKNARIIKSIQADHRIALTGTPIENTLSELWSLFDFVMPGYLYSARKFTNLYELPITKDNSKEKASRLKMQIAPFIMRRLKTNVLHELPPKTETTLMAEMLPEQQKLYAAHLSKAKGELKELLSAGPLKGGRLQILAQLTRLRQLCCHPSLCVENYRGGSGKLDLALETIQIALESGHRCLLFSQFTEMLSILQKSLQKEEISYFYLDGTTPAAERIDTVDRFNAGERDLFLISLKAGGTGLNLTGADIVIHYDPWWNPSVMDQASDRAYRLGQNKAVQVFNLVAMQTLEERIMELQAKKRRLIDTVLTEEQAGTLQSLTDAEIEELLIETHA